MLYRAIARNCRGAANLTVSRPELCALAMSRSKPAQWTRAASRTSLHSALENRIRFEVFFHKMKRVLQGTLHRFRDRKSPAESGSSVGHPGCDLEDQPHGGPRREEVDKFTENDHVPRLWDRKSQEDGLLERGRSFACRRHHFPLYRSHGDTVGRSRAVCKLARISGQRLQLSQ